MIASVNVSLRDDYSVKNEEKNGKQRNRKATEKFYRDALKALIKTDVKETPKRGYTEVNCIEMY